LYAFLIFALPAALELFTHTSDEITTANAKIIVNNFLEGCE